MNDILENLKKVQIASKQLILIPEEKINNILLDLSNLIEQKIEFIVTENKKDLANMDFKDPKYDRLQLTENRIIAIANDLKNVASLEIPFGRILEKRILENGLELTKITVPLGVIGIIYEARPNVTVDVFSLCFKSGNACILKGGKEANDSNIAFISLIHQILVENNISKDIVSLISNNRDDLAIVLSADQYIDVIIPRGSQELINYVRANSKIPVIETGAGIVHTYFDQSGELAIAKNIINNAKTRRVSVCNALDTLIIHKSRLNDLPELISLLDNRVEIFADKESYQSLEGKYNLLNHANEKDFGTEFLSMKMSVKTVNNFYEAVEHINKYSSKHSEAIISQDDKNINLFTTIIDAAVVYVNTSTAFTDGGQFGLGAEIGISTQKLHARGPMALRELNSYKWIIKGNGQVRNN
ncbi:MAG: glutamate-5-semialdehyde dehydrogenase [Candidatus Sericytochromatia bacterium]|nr:glutamate-5-semialdehyde dehydrogenase [Candidatus Sericytochromatia bacterium]